MKVLLIILALTAALTENVYADEPNFAFQQAQGYSFDEIEQVIDENDEKYGIDFNFGQALENRLNMEDSSGTKGIIKNIAEIFFGELYSQMSIMRNIFIICVLSGIFKSLTDSFKTKEISETGFYMCYMAVVALLINSFIVGLGVLEELTDFAAELSRASAPVLAAVMMSCGEITAGGAFSSIIVFAASLCSDFIKAVFIPGVKMAAAISIVNYLSNKEMLERLSKFISGGLNMLLKIGAFVFMGIVSVQKISTGAADNAVSKTVQAGIGAVPVIGDVFSSAAQSIMGWSMVLKTGIGISLVLACVISAAVPIAKLLAVMLIYKITAIFTEPFCDKRIICCIDTIGSYMLMALSAAVTVIIVYIFAVIVFISAIGG